MVKKTPFLANKDVQIKTKLLAILKNPTKTVTDACTKVGISRTTFYKFKRDDKEFAERLENMDEELVDLAESQLVKLAQKGYFPAIDKILKSKGKKRGWGDEVSVAIQPVQWGVEKSPFMNPEDAEDSQALIE